MAKKKKNKEELPEGMSRRQAKLAARAAERAALEKDPRPFGGFASETQLIAMQEFVPSATAKLSVKGIDRDVYVCTILPGASAAMVRDTEAGGDAYVALQVRTHTHNPGRNLAYALNWVKNANDGDTLESTAADGVQPDLKDILDESAVLEITDHQDFAWWMPEGTQMTPEIAQTLNQANETVIESHQVGADIDGTLFWAASGGDKAHVRWVFPVENETGVLNAIARVAARGEMNLGEGTKFAGVFRTHGLIAPVFDVQQDVAYDSYDAELARVEKALKAEIDNDAQLNPEERKQLENLKSRQVTLR